MTDIECPLCQRVDMVQKITAIVEGETHQTRGYSSTVNNSNISGQQNYYSRQDGYVGRGDLSGEIHSHSTTGISATQKSHLAQNLQSPLKPSSPIEPNFDTSVFSKLPENMNTGIGIAVWLLVSMLLFTVFPNVDNSSTTGISIVCIGAPLITAILAAVVEHVWNQTTFPPDEREELLIHYERETQRYEQVMLPRWEKAMRRWRAMYYCRRCDVIYVPNDDIKPQSPDRTLEVCYHRKKNTLTSIHS